MIIIIMVKKYIKDYRYEYKSCWFTYENLYNEDKDIRKKELDKVIGEDKVHWLLHKNMLDKLHPQFKYTNLPIDYQKKDIL